MQNIITRSRLIQVSASMDYIPTSPIWVIRNTGTYTMLINQIFKVLPGSVFGSNADAIVTAAILQGKKVEDKTKIKIDFIQAGGSTVLGVKGENLGEAVIIETEINY